MQKRIQGLKELVIKLLAENEKYAAPNKALTGFQAACFVSINKQLFKARKDLKNLLRKALIGNKITLEMYKMHLQELDL